jgi:succinoglycan biosynthesis protein ExoO
MPYVSVIVPAYDAADFIANAYRSVVDQTISDWEIIFVNDGSRDETLSIMQSFAAADKRIKIVDLALNAGPAYARNAGLAVAEGAWIALLDADDRYSPNRLEMMTRALERTGADIALDNQFIVDPISGRTTFLAFEPGQDDVRVLTFAEFLLNNQSNSLFDFGYLKPIIRRPWLTANGAQYPEALRHAEDLVFLLECYARDAKAILLSEPYYHYFFQYSQSSGAKSPTTRTEVRYEPLLATIEEFLDANRSQLSILERRLVASICEATREAMTVMKLKAYLKKWNILGLLGVLPHPIRLIRGVYFAKRRSFLWRRRIKMYSSSLKPLG